MTLLKRLTAVLAALHVSGAAVISAESPSRRTLRALMDVATPASSDAEPGQEGASSQIVVSKVQDASQRLRICNAFTNPSAIIVRLVRTGKELSLLGYKQCNDLSVVLMEGDQLDFRVQGLSVGFFTMHGLPRDPRTLLLVVHKRRAGSMAAGFKSHAFAEDATGISQVAIIDTYRDNATSRANAEEKVHINTVSQVNSTAGEDLPLNAVVNVKPGSYQVALNRAGLQLAQALFSAKAQTSYVVLRVGDAAEPDGTRPFPLELVVFPQLMSGSYLAGGASGLLFALLLHFVTMP